MLDSIFFATEQSNQKQYILNNRPNSLGFKNGDFLNYVKLFRQNTYNDQFYGKTFTGKFGLVVTIWLKKTVQRFNTGDPWGIIDTVPNTVSNTVLNKYRKRFLKWVQTKLNQLGLRPRTKLVN